MDGMEVGCLHEEILCIRLVVSRTRHYLVIWSKGMDLKVVWEPILFPKLKNFRLHHHETVFAKLEGSIVS